jgi:hypothetical protein|tara:strand:- start:486 stop:731 length:246 start_codon:yes stop_codon:yes gene_type:complete
MVKPDNYSGKSLEADIIKWRHVKGGTDRDGKVVSQPLQLYQAEIIDGICQRYGQLPSAVLEENASLLKLLHIVSLNEEKPN